MVFQERRFRMEHLEIRLDRRRANQLGIPFLRGVDVNPKGLRFL